MNKKMYPMYLKGLTAVFSMAVASTLIGCQQANPKIKIPITKILKQLKKKTIAK